VLLHQSSEFSMATRHVLDLPREIRDQIYVLAFSSSTGYICHSLTYDSDPPIRRLIGFRPPSSACWSDNVSIPLLQTCRQIYGEAQGLVFKHNIWVGGRVEHFALRFPKIQPLLGHRIQHLWVEIDLTYRRGLEYAAKSLQMLRTLAEQNAQLRSITLRIATGKYEMMRLINLDQYGEPVWLDSGQLNPHVGERLLEEYVTVFLDACGQRSWPGVQRKLEFEVDRLDERCSHDPGGFVKKLHNAFGGELWFRHQKIGQSSEAGGNAFCDRLCYKDGEEISKPFAKSAAYHGWQVVWFRADNESYWKGAINS